MSPEDNGVSRGRGTNGVSRHFDGLEGGVFLDDGEDVTGLVFLSKRDDRVLILG
jgi:hypothetical protein